MCALSTLSYSQACALDTVVIGYCCHVIHWTVFLQLSVRSGKYLYEIELPPLESLDAVLMTSWGHLLTKYFHYGCSFLSCM